MIKAATYLEDVREQYENYPYPPRNPEDEKTRLTLTEVDILEKVNYYCFEGKQSFDNGFRVLVAGGGTGDTTIFVAEQLRGKNAEIVHLDMSEASINVAKQRAKARGLDNITWMHESLLELPNIKIEKFDYINSIGVLHHLADPVAGLKALKSVLKDDGAMGLMVYAKYGRTGIYHIQDLMRMVNEGEENLQKQVDNCKSMLTTLPNTNWFARTNHGPNSDHLRYGDVGIYDMLLHTQDRSYTVPELYEWVESCGLVLRDLLGGRGAAIECYEPETFVKNPELLQKIRSFPKAKQQAIAELLCGIINTHTFYVSTKPRVLPDIGNLENIPFLSILLTSTTANPYETIYKSLEGLRNKGAVGEKIGLALNERYKVRLTYMKHHPDIFKLMDGRKTIGEIFAEVGKTADDKPSNEILSREFEEIFSAFNRYDLMFLRYKNTPVPKTYQEMKIA